MVKEYAKPNSNQLKAAQMYSNDDFVKVYSTRVGNRKSEFDTPIFYEAVELAKANPNSYVKFYSFASPEFMEVKRKGQACAQFATKYFKDNKMNNYVATSRKTGNKTEVFIVNVVEVLDITEE